MPFSPLPEIFEELRAGRMVILVDDPDRENEGDLVFAAEMVTPEKIAFMLRHTSGIICVTMPEEKAVALDLPLQVAPSTNSSRFGTQFTVSVEAKEGVTTGVSAADRATTIQTIARDDCTPQDLARPGHVYPIRGVTDGVLRRSGQTEGSIDLCRLAGLQPLGVISELMNPDGTMSRMPDLERFAGEHGLKICSVRDVIQWRRHKERLIRHETAATLPTHVGDFTLHVYTARADPEPHLALTLGIPTPPGDGSNPPIEESVLVRAHSECLSGDVFGSLRCDCGEQLRAAQAHIAREGRGVILYMRQEGRGIGLVNKIRAYALQEQKGLDTVEANVELGFKPDHRDYGVGAQILYDLGLRRLRLLTNNPVKFRALKGYGLDIVERVPLEMPPTSANERYLRAKAEKMGHLFTFPGAGGKAKTGD
ncbi:MAG: GTP cyclohydrolase II [Planctomycetota bacterium]|jgi:3,4-dihydroxy 2-butanone 4-phosphate synthase/GTP cyclohydrolase II